MEAKDFVRMFAYDDWANRECLTAMQASAAVSPELVQRMAHILSAKTLWLGRILKQPQSTPVWPAASVDDCLALATEVSSAWQNYLARLGNQFAPGSLEDIVEYRNSKGEAWSSRVEDILIHALFHSAYHRGQIAMQMRSTGMQPAYTDFIHAVRMKFVE